MRVWPLAACLLALTLGIAPAYADTVATAHQDGRIAPQADATPSANGGTNTIAPVTGRDAVAQADPSTSDAPASADEAGVTTDPSTHTVTHTSVSGHYVTSVTKSVSIAVDDDGNKAIAKAIATAHASTNPASRLEGTVTSKTSVDVTGNGVASASAGGSITVSGGQVDVATWGKTSAEVF